MREFSLQFFLKVGDLLITIPVNPEELEIVKELGYETYANLDKKEILTLQEDKLMELEIESVLEQTVSSASVTDTPWKPEQYLNTFNGWRNNRTVVRVTSSDGQIDFEGYIVRVVTSYEGGTSDYGYTLKIVQERSIELIANIDNNYSKIDIEYQVLRYTPQANPVVETNTATTQTVTTPQSTVPVSNPSVGSQTVTYTVKSGDTLSGIARMYYGNSNKWTDIFNANKDKIKNANMIYVGQVLTIPNATNTVKSSTSSTGAVSTTNKQATSTSKTTSLNIPNETATPLVKTGHENQPGYKVINGVEFWGLSQLAEQDSKWSTYFYFDSGTYQQHDNTNAASLGPAKVGKIANYVYVTNNIILNKDGTKYVSVEHGGSGKGF